VALDEVRLQQQRLGLRVGDGEVDVVGARYHLADAGRPRVGVRPHPVAEVDRLPDVGDRVAVEELVDARLPRQFVRPLANRGRVHRGGLVGERV